MPTSHQRTFKRLLLGAAAAAAFSLASAAQQTASWQGSYTANSERHRVILQATQGKNGAWTVDALNIDFLPETLHLDAATLAQAHLTLTSNGGKGALLADLSPDGSTLRGTWTWDKQSSPLTLTRVSDEVAWHTPLDYQYHLHQTTYTRPSPQEPRIPFSPRLAVDYMEQGAMAWTSEWHCVACHSNGTYMVVRPLMTPMLGAPQADLRQFFVATLNKALKADPKDLPEQSTQLIYVAAGLAIWDAHVTHTLSPETAQALELMFGLQRPAGDWYVDDDNNPPLESSAFQLATVAARAVANAPGWLKGQRGTPLEARVNQLKRFLREPGKLQGDYDRTDLLWTASEYPGLLTASQMRELVAMILTHQQFDGGWSIRSFAAPEDWGKGNRAGKLRAELEFPFPQSDGHMTGLAIIALRKAGVPATDSHIQRGVQWLLANQRASGRWYTRSLNRDGYQFITYSGTAYPLLALSLCNALPAQLATSPGSTTGR